MKGLGNPFQGDVKELMNIGTGDCASEEDNTNKKELFALLTSRVPNFQFPENKEVNVTSDEFVVTSRGCSHEEADTRIALHVQHALDKGCKQDSLLQHTLRAVYQSSNWYTSLQSVQMVPSPEGWGWCEMDGTWKPVWMTLPEAAKACLELLKCGCKQGCTGRCKCRKANLPCTGLCPCSGECTNNEH
ncbi:hypothetical protein P5673_015007 [Acropora cervicornis]|uniref:Tesmin/TSO1-like CXC domain-containing protein n=1 Tax=Acropora cervicornis TaxID=6130 RepID=A0AAD9QIR4_ACRCE|nr:hypothetical protein P5673_015007 [Acropora cervicornis]